MRGGQEVEAAGLLIPRHFPGVRLRFATQQSRGSRDARDRACARVSAAASEK